MAMKINGSDSFQYDAQKAAQQKAQAARDPIENKKEENPSIPEQPIEQQLRTPSQLQPDGDIIDLSLAGQAQLRARNTNSESDKRTQQQNELTQKVESERYEQQIRDNQVENRESSREINQASTRAAESRTEARDEIDERQQAQIRLDEQLQRQQENRDEASEEDGRRDDRSLDLLI